MEFARKWQNRKSPKKEGSRPSTIKNFGNESEQAVLAVVIPEPALPEVQHEFIGCTAVELRRAALCKTPEVLRPVGVAFAPHEPVMRMEHTVMAVPVEYQPG